MTRSHILVSFSFLLFSLYSVADESTKTMPVETIQQIDNLNNVMDKAKELELLVERNSRQKYSDCIKAFGNQKFCQCLKDKSPVGISFAGYIQIVTTTKEELGYLQADKETKLLIDNTLRTRESCVSGSK